MSPKLLIFRYVSEISEVPSGCYTAISESSPAGSGRFNIMGHKIVAEIVCYYNPVG